MRNLIDEHWLAAQGEYHALEDYQSGTPRWCSGCGDHAILTALLRLCRDEQLAPEKAVFVSGIGCASRLPHYLKTYGFHSLHGRALPVAEGIKIRRPDLHVFVTTGDGDCCSIGTAHWIHAIRYNMDMTVMLHDNNIYGLTKMQVSPTSPKGLRSNTSPRGACLEALNPLITTLSVANVSFVAQAADWIPEVLYAILSRAFHHRGFSFVRILQRCPNYLPSHFDAWLQDPNRILLLTHPQGLAVDASLARVYRSQTEHDPADLSRARELASRLDLMPIGILYRNPSVPRYEELWKREQTFTPEMIGRALNKEFDKFTVEPWAVRPPPLGLEPANRSPDAPRIPSGKRKRAGRNSSRDREPSA